MINLCRKILLRLKTEDGWTHAKAAMCGKKREVLSLIPNVSFSNVPCWYGASRRDLKMDLIAPKNRTKHPACPAN